MQNDSTIPLGLCQCGCGQPTKIAQKNRPDRKWIKGQPQLYCYGHAKMQPIKVRFWKWVGKNGPIPLHRPELGPCWLWQGPVYHSGHGMLGRGRRTEGQIRAHRFSWELHNGSIPAKLNVCHKCDNPPCVNPNHLFPGTQQDNITDMINKGRNFKLPTIYGENHPNAKLNGDKVRAIRKAVASGEAKTTIMRRFSISRSVIYQIISGRTWHHTNS